MNKIVLLGVRDLATEETIKPQTDYAISLIAQRISEESEDQDSDDNPVIKYRLKVDHIELIQEIGTSNEVKFEKGKSPSEKQRFAITRQTGDDEYQPFMAWLLVKIPDLIDEYRDR